MVGERHPLLVLRAEAVALFGKAGSVFRNIDKVPVVAFVALFPYRIRPSLRRRQRVSASRSCKFCLAAGRKTRCRDVSDDCVAGHNRGGNEGYYSKRAMSFFTKPRITKFRKFRPQ